MTKRNCAREARDLLWNKLGEKAPLLREQYPQGVHPSDMVDTNIYYFLRNPQNNRCMHLLEGYCESEGGKEWEEIFGLEGYSQHKLTDFWIQIGYTRSAERNSIDFELIGDFSIDQRGSILPEGYVGAECCSKWREKEFREKWGKTGKYTPELIEFVVDCFTQDLGFIRRFK